MLTEIESTLLEYDKNVKISDELFHIYNKYMPVDIGNYFILEQILIFTTWKGFWGLSKDSVIDD